jgi:hypothetical protein
MIDGAQGKDFFCFKSVLPEVWCKSCLLAGMPVKDRVMSQPKCFKRDLIWM